MLPSGTMGIADAMSGVGSKGAGKSLRRVSLGGAGVEGVVEVKERGAGAAPWARAGSVVLPMASEAKRATLQDSKFGKRRRFTCI